MSIEGKHIFVAQFETTVGTLKSQLPAQYHAAKTYQTGTF
jgi:hypothetical protein